MLAFLFRRLGQGLLVVAVMATLVFVGVYALGNPIDILISPEADQLEREQAIRRLGLDQPFWMQFWLGLMLILAFSVELKWLPAGGRGETREILGIQWSFVTLDGLRHLVLPAL